MAMPDEIRSVSLQQLKPLTLNHKDGPIACYSHEDMCSSSRMGSRYVLIREEIEIPMKSTCMDTTGTDLAREIIRVVQADEPYFDRAIYSYQVNVDMRGKPIYLASFYMRTDFDRVRAKADSLKIVE